jgi:hypothetical protein
MWCSLDTHRNLKSFDSLDEHDLAGTRPAIAAREGRAYRHAIVTSGIDEESGQMYYLSHSQSRELGAYARVSGNYVSVGAVLNHILTGNGQSLYRSPGIESSRLCDLERAEHPVVGHGAPSQSEVLWDEIG